MSDKYKHSEQLEDLLRYKNDLMTGEERYKFERELERDPFLQEAFEGLEGMKASELDRDIRSMDVIAGKRKISLDFLRYVGYAAGLAILVLVGFWAVQHIHPSKDQVVKNEADTLNQQYREPYKPAVTASKRDSVAIDTTRETIAVAQAAPPPPPKGQDQQAAQNQPFQFPKTEKFSEIRDAARKANTLGAVVPQQAVKAKTDEDNEETVTVNESSEALATSAVSSEKAKEENMEDMAEPLNVIKRPGVNADPQPLGGNTLFRNYLNDNTKYPSSSKSTRKETVKIRFSITTNGDPTGYVIEQSPGESFTEEAIRVIKNGPRWSPKIKDGIPVVSDVTVKITFKPDNK